MNKIQAISENQHANLFFNSGLSSTLKIAKAVTDPEYIRCTKNGKGQVTVRDSLEFGIPNKYTGEATCIADYLALVEYRNLLQQIIFWTRRVKIPGVLQQVTFLFRKLILNLLYTKTNKIKNINCAFIGYGWLHLYIQSLYLPDSNRFWGFWYGFEYPNPIIKVYIQSLGFERVYEFKTDAGESRWIEINETYSSPKIKKDTFITIDLLNGVELKLQFKRKLVDFLEDSNLGFQINTLNLLFQPI